MHVDTGHFRPAFRTRPGLHSYLSATEATRVTQQPPACLMLCRSDVVVCGYDGGLHVIRMGVAITLYDLVLMRIT